MVGVLGDDTDPMVTVMKLEKAPQETYADIGGLDTQIQEIKESVELPLTHPEYYEEMGIRPPKGVILYGPPGTGKTLLAKAVANQTSATFLRVVGSELIQKYLVSTTLNNPSHINYGASSCQQDQTKTTYKCFHKCIYLYIYYCDHSLLNHMRRLIMLKISLWSFNFYMTKYVWAISIKRFGYEQYIKL